MVMKFAMPADAPDTRVRAFADALRMHRDGDHAKALQHLCALGNPCVLPPDFGNLAGVCAKRCGDKTAAESYYFGALAQNAAHTAARNNLAILLQETGRLAEAEEHYREAIRLGSGDPLPYFNFGNLLFSIKRHEEAEAAYRGALERAPDMVEARNRLLEVLHVMKRTEAIEVVYRQALIRHPDDPEMRNDLGILLHETKRYEESEATYRHALALKPDYAEAWNNLAVLVQKLKRFDDAEAAYRQALTYRPDYAAARCNYGLLCLTQGRFAQGWPLYEARYAPDRTVPVPKLSKPQWRGESLDGKSILIWSEQGMGDEIQFCRYAKTLKAHGARRVGLVCKKPLAALLRGVSGVDVLHEEGERFSIRPYDFWTFPLTIPMYCCPTPADIPSEHAYLSADPARQRHWASRLSASGFKVGLVWKGRAEYSNDANRSLPSLRELSSLWSLPGITFFSLQKDEAEDEAANPLEGQPLVALGAEFRDFSDTAAVASQLDLVICVDTAIAHLCGALGVPCWVLLPYIGTDWRWMLDRSDSPWYPSLRLFRQPAPHAWQQVVSSVRESLSQWIATSNLSRHIRYLPADDMTTLEVMTALLSGRPITGALSFSRWCALAILLHESDRLEAADAAYHQALTMNDRSRGLWHNFAALCRRRKHLGEAEESYRCAFAAEGDYPEGYYNLGNLYGELDRLDAAEDAYRRAIALRPNYAEAWYSLGVILKARNQPDAAEEGYRTALTFKPRYAEACNNLGVVLQERQHFDEAAIEFEAALAIRPDYDDARWNLALMHLVRGRFSEAWPLFDARTRITRCQTHLPPLPFPFWQGESLVGKRILIWPEQGFGDEIQFCRYASLLKTLGAAVVTIACKPPLTRLFRRLPNVEGCLEVHDGTINVPIHDFWIFSMSLPSLFGTTLETIPNRLPYLTATDEDRSRFLDILPKPGVRRIGLAWKGSPAHPNDRNRSLLSPELLASIVDTVSDTAFFNLQIDDDSETDQLGLPIRHLGGRIRDFSDTAAAISMLDCVICVDTAIAHLAGALGVPVWVLLPHAGLDWRWMADRSDSPWYPHVMRLFRQSAEGGWASAITAVREALHESLEENRK